MASVSKPVNGKDVESERVGLQILARDVGRAYVERLRYGLEA
jgi:hypothetical protein